MINAKIVQELNLPLENKIMRVITVDSIKDGSRDVASFKVSNLKGDYNFDVSKALVGNILTLEGDVPPSKKDIESFSHLEGVEFEELPNKEIGMILSADFAWSWMGGECRKGAQNEPVSFSTVFGWALIGCNRSSTPDMVSHYRSDVDDLEIRNGIDNHAVEQLQKTTEFDSDLGHWRVGLPWDLHEGDGFVTDAYLGISFEKWLDSA